MSCKAGNKNHKQRCEKYRQQGRRAINKENRAERHKKRMQRFAERREAGKAYEYSKERTEQKRENRIPIGSNLGSTQPRHTEFAKQDSINRKLRDSYNEQQKEIARRMAAGKKKEGNEES